MVKVAEYYSILIAGIQSDRLRTNVSMNITERVQLFESVHDLNYQVEGLDIVNEVIVLLD